jgi:hypothetical protein
VDFQKRAAEDDQQKPANELAITQRNGELKLKKCRKVLLVINFVSESTTPCSCIRTPAISVQEIGPLQIHFHTSVCGSLGCGVKKKLNVFAKKGTNDAKSGGEKSTIL